MYTIVIYTHVCTHRSEIHNERSFALENTTIHTITLERYTPDLRFQYWQHIGCFQRNSSGWMNYTSSKSRNMRNIVITICVTFVRPSTQHTDLRASLAIHGTYRINHKYITQSFYPYKFWLPSVKALTAFWKKKTRPKEYTTTTCKPLQCSTVYSPGAVSPPLPSHRKLTTLGNWSTTAASSRAES